MSRLAPKSEVNNLQLRQRQAVAAIMVQPWLTAHLVTVRRALAWFGVTEREDRADLAQDVFLSAYVALVRGEQIMNPRAWLRECARKYASNYRHKGRRRSSHLAGDLLVYGKDPEMLMSERERLHQALAILTGNAQAIVFDIRVGGVTWAEAARKQGITIDQARYTYECAILEMKKAVEIADKTPLVVVRSAGAPGKKTRERWKGKMA